MFFLKFLAEIESKYYFRDPLPSLQLRMPWCDLLSLPKAFYLPQRPSAITRMIIEV